MKYPTPTQPGHWWAKLRLANQPSNEDWNSPDWEVVQVFDNNGDGDEAYMAFVPGVPIPQVLDAFVWGPEVLKPDELS